MRFCTEVVKIVKKYFINFRLREQILLATFLLIILPVLIVGLWINYRVTETLQQQAVNSENQVARNVSVYLEQALLAREDSLVTVAGLAGWQNDTIRRQNMGALLHSSMGFTQVSFQDQLNGTSIVLTASGTHVSSVKGMSPSPSSMSKALNNNSNYDLSKVMVTGIEGNGNSTGWLVFGIPIHEAQGQELGTLQAYWPIQDLQQGLRQSLLLPAGTHVWLSDSTGQYVLEPQNLNVLPAAVRDQEKYSPALISALSQSAILSESYISRLRWHLVVAQDKNLALALVGRVSYEIGYITLGILLLAFALSALYIRSLLYPVRGVIGYIQALGNGAAVEDLPPLRLRRNELGEAVKAVAKLAAQTQQVLRETVMCLVTALEARDPYTRNHSERAAIYARLLARQVGYPAGKMENLSRAALLHDVGKIGVPEYILNKQGSLNEEELRLMRVHPRQSYDIVRSVPLYEEAGITQAILQHHERWDGHGYPDGICREELTYEARILAIADAFDAMTSDRVYRKALSLNHALNEISKGAGKQFDPKLAEAFLQIPRKDFRLVLVFL